MNVLVTGATGFVGGHVADVLLGRGDHVTVLARSAARAARLAAAGARVVLRNLDDRDALRAAVSDQDVVIHAAGLIAARRTADYDRVNRDGTERLVAAAAGCGRPRFVLVSSLAAAGPARPGRPRTLDDGPPSPVTAYGRSKLAGEAVVRASELAWTIVRPPMVYGPFDTELLKIFRVARTGVVPVLGSSRQELSAVEAGDLARALVRVADLDRAVGHTYYACHPEVFTSEALARAVGHAVGRRVRIVTLPGPIVRAVLTVTGAWSHALGRATILNRDKANELLEAAWTCDPTPLMRDSGWAAENDVASGVRATAAWYRERGWL